MGPTASGKTAAALALADAHNVAIVSVDSAMVFRGLDIGTAKPSNTIRRVHPHALVDVRNPGESFSASDFLAEADCAVLRAFESGRVPLLVGGSMLYFRAFREGLTPLPAASPEFRADLKRRAAERGVSALHEELAGIDPECASGIDPNNYSRIERALEVEELTGKPLSAWWKSSPGVPATQRHGARLVEFAITELSRERLHQRIGVRLDRMLADGFIDEVAALLEQPDVTPESQAMRSLGYMQVCSHLQDGSESTDLLRERVLAATRQAAKRQLTWLRRWPDLEARLRLDPETAAEELAEEFRSIDG